MIDKRTQANATSTQIHINDLEAIVEVNPRHSGGAISKTLTAAGVVKSEAAFLAATARNPDARSIQAGRYKLQKEMSVDAAILALLDVKNRYVKKVLVTEGMSTFDIYKKLSTELGRPVEDFQNAPRNTLSRLVLPKHGSPAKTAGRSQPGRPKGSCSRRRRSSTPTRRQSRRLRRWCRSSTRSLQRSASPTPCRRTTPIPHMRHLPPPRSPKTRCHTAWTCPS